MLICTFGSLATVDYVTRPGSPLCKSKIHVSTTVVLKYIVAHCSEMSDCSIDCIQRAKMGNKKQKLPMHYYNVKGITTQLPLVMPFDCNGY